MAREVADIILSVIGQLVVAGGGGAVIAFGLFRFLGKGWIENQLAKDLEAAKAEIALLSARRLKLHDREYEVFPAVWGNLKKAERLLGAAVASMRSVPDLDRLDDAGFEEWLAGASLTESEKKYLRSEPKKNDALIHLMEWQDLRLAQEAFQEFREHFQANRIFLRPDVKEKLDKIDDRLHSAWVAKQMHWEGHRDGGFLKESFSIYSKEIKPLVEEIEAMVQAQLFPPTTVK